MVYINHNFPHTPAPWIAFEELLSPNELHVAGRCPIVKHENHIIAMMPRFLNHRLVNPVDQEAEANARLISMAPIMEAYIMKRAVAGDAEATTILRSIAQAGQSQPRT